MIKRNFNVKSPSYSYVTALILETFNKDFKLNALLSILLIFWSKLCITLRGYYVEEQVKSCKAVSKNHIFSTLSWQKCRQFVWSILGATWLLKKKRSRNGFNAISWKTFFLFFCGESYSFTLLPHSSDSYIRLACRLQQTFSFR